MPNDPTEELKIVNVTVGNFEQPLRIVWNGPGREPICTCGKPFTQCTRMHDDHYPPKYPPPAAEELKSADALPPRPESCTFWNACDLEHPKSNPQFEVRAYKEVEADEYMDALEARALSLQAQLAEATKERDEARKEIETWRWAIGAKDKQILEYHDAVNANGGQAADLKAQLLSERSRVREETIKECAVPGVFIWQNGERWILQSSILALSAPQPKEEL